jgi:hypothetical protein
MLLSAAPFAIAAPPAAKAHTNNVNTAALPRKVREAMSSFLNRLQSASACEVLL